jgi:hypothetical protein
MNALQRVSKNIGSHYGNYLKNRWAIEYFSSQFYFELNIILSKTIYNDICHDVIPT